MIADYNEIFNNMMATDLSLIDILNRIKDENDVVSIPQKELAKRLTISPTNVSKRLQRMMKYGIVKKIKSGQYQILNADLQNSLYNIVFDLLKLLKEKPELYHDYKSQCKELNIELTEVQRAWGFINNSFGAI